MLPSLRPATGIVDKGATGSPMRKSRSRSASCRTRPYPVKEKGRVTLQNHNSLVEFRNVRIWPLKKLPHVKTTISRWQLRFIVFRTFPTHGDDATSDDFDNAKGTHHVDERVDF